jgi:hypothetical protein
MPDTLLIRCAACGATNRVPREKLVAGLQPVCGRCGATLSVGSQPLTVTDANRMISPVVEELASEMTGRLRVGKLNVDENPSTAARFNITSIPTLLVLNGGREIERIVGVRPKSEIARRLQRALA